ncbi:MAG: amidohydrolase [Bacteroidia bacterium]|nr:amidohydrolase [Bacteroidia bacterium]
MKILTTLTFLLLYSLLLNDPSTETLKTTIKEDLNYLVDFYKERHSNPEISLREKETAASLANELRTIGFEVTEKFGGHGIVGVYRNGDGPMILYRTDMDALPMAEKTDLEYASEITTDYNGTTVGTMHSCGHDMHMTTWIGTARAMVAMKDQWSGTLMLIGQPAEEIGQGAKMMLDNGLYDTFGVPNFGIGLHCSPVIPSGKVGFGKGYTMANTESISIKVFGQGAHGASPHMSVDPIVLASMIVMDLQTIVSRNIKPTDDAVITVGSFQGGVVHNIIPDEVTLKLTVRTFKEAVRLKVHQRIREITRGVAIAAGMPEDRLPIVDIPEVFTPANYNDPELVDKMIKASTPAIGGDAILDAEPLMVGEDFSRYGSTEHKVPTVLFWLGTVSEEKIESGNLPGLHSPFYYPEIEKTIETGVQVVTSSLLSLFTEG